MVGSADFLVFMPNGRTLCVLERRLRLADWRRPKGLTRAPEQVIDLKSIITMNNLDVKTIAHAHGFGQAL
jgi:hypothetical protein